jgi:hypothetical protein
MYTHGASKFNTYATRSRCTNAHAANGPNFYCKTSVPYRDGGRATVVPDCATSTTSLGFVSVSFGFTPFGTFWTIPTNSFTTYATTAAA